MSGLIENYIRRIEKIVPERSTVPLVGTNHVDDTWIETDIYPGELSVNLQSGSLYTSDGLAIIDLNRENMILSGMVLSKDTSGVLKLTVSSGHVRIDGKHYYHLSATGSGTDVLLPTNFGPHDKLYFLYAQATNGIAIGHQGASGDLQCSLGYTSVSGLLTEPGGVFESVSLTSGVPPIPSDSVLLGTVLVYVGSTGYELWPRSVANVGDYYPRFSVSPSELLRNFISDVKSYDAHSLYFPGTFVIDNVSNTIYLSKKTFVSSYTSITEDITLGNLVSLGSGGGTGSTSGIFDATNVGTGATVYKQIVGTQIQFRSLTGTSPIQITGSADEIVFSLDTSSLLMGVTNLGSGSPVWQSTIANVARLRSIRAGSNVTVSHDASNITVSVPEIGTTAQGINLGTGLTVYTGMSGKDLTFKSLGFTGGLTATVTPTEILISGSNLAQQGVNYSGGIGIYAGMSGQDLAFYGLSAGSNVELTYVGQVIVISASGGSGSGTVTGGENVGSTGATVYYGMSGSNLAFRNLVPSTGIEIATVDEDIYISTTITDGAQGAQGFQGADGINGTDGIDGIDGSQGPQGLKGETGADSTVQGPQGFQGYTGPQGDIGYQGSMGPQGTPVDMRFIDVYDAIGTQTITTAGNQDIWFGTTRVNTDPALYTVIGATSIQINEDGNYQFVYNITAQVQSGTRAHYELYRDGLVITGSRIYAESKADDWVTSTGKVGLTCSAGQIFHIKATVVAGTQITTIQFASSFIITKLEIGIGPQGPAMEGAQGPAGTPGPVGPTGDALVNTLVPLTGNGASATPVELMYSDDFILDAFNRLYLNLDFTTLATPTISRQWLIYKNDGVTPFPATGISYGSTTVSVGATLTSSAIRIPVGCNVNYGGTATIPAPGSGQAQPTSISGDWTWDPGATGPTSSYLATGPITSTTTYDVELTKPQNGLIVVAGRVVRPTGNDTTSASDSVTFNEIFYWGGTTALGSGNISQATADTIQPSDIEALTNYRFGTQAQTITGVSDGGVGRRLVLAYPSTYADLTSIILDGAAPILGAFYKVSGTLNIQTISGIAKTYKVYVAVADNSYSGNQITTN